MTTPIDPRSFDAPGWAARTTLLLTPYGFIPVLAEARQWVGWAAYVSSLPALAALGAPRPERFAGWREWAGAFNQAVGMLRS